MLRLLCMITAKSGKLILDLDVSEHLLGTNTPEKSRGFCDVSFDPSEGQIADNKISDEIVEERVQNQVILPLWCLLNQWWLQKLGKRRVLLILSEPLHYQYGNINTRLENRLVA